MRRITITGLAALCALALAAVGAAGASAVEVPTTAFTCLKGETDGLGHKFTNEDCSVENNTTGTFGHKRIPANTPTQLTLKQIVPAKFTTIIAGASVTLEATGVECLKCMAENQEPTAEKMRVFGSGGQLTFSGVTVASSPVKCMVSSTDGANTIITEELQVETTATNEAGIKPVTGTALAVFEITSNPGQTCPVAGTYTISGDANGTLKGAFLTIAVPSASKTLTIGVNGASLVGEATVSAGLTGVAFESEHHPVALA